MDHKKSGSCLGSQEMGVQLNKQKGQIDLYNERKQINQFDLITFLEFAKVLAIFAWMYKVK